MELDHVLCMVGPEEDWADRLTAAGWVLDAGSAHPGQGTRNRRLVLHENYLELLWIEDWQAARDHPLRLDRRADWRRTGASPFGFGLRGRLPDDQRHDYWLLGGLPMPVWVHRDDERAPDRPLVFVLDVAAAPAGLSGRGRSGRPAVVGDRARLRAVRHFGPAPAPLPPFGGPTVDWRAGTHRLQLVVDRGRPTAVADLLLLEAPAGLGSVIA